MKNTTRTLALLLGTALFGLASTAQAQCQHCTKERIINLQATAKKLVANDEMNASLYFEEQQTNPSILAKNLANAMNAALATAKSHTDVKASTGQQYTHPVYNKNNQITSWQGRAQIDLTSKNFEQMSKLIAKLQRSLKLGNVGFSISDTKREQVESELMIEASKKFQSRAQALLGTWQASSYTLLNLQLNTSGGYGQPVMYGMERKMAADMSGAPEQNYAGGESEVSVVANGSVQLN